MAELVIFLSSFIVSISQELVMLPVILVIRLLLKYSLCAQKLDHFFQQ